MQRVFPASLDGCAGPADWTADTVPRAVGIRHARVPAPPGFRGNGPDDRDHGKDDGGGENESKKNPLHGILLEMTVPRFRIQKTRRPFYRTSFALSRR